MDELEELRYPWDNAVEFFGNGYVFELGSLHLLIGWIVVLWLVTQTARRLDVPVVFRLACLYFALTLFTNPAFNFVGLNLNEVFGVLAVVRIPFERSAPNTSQASPVVLGVLTVFAIGLAHMFVAQLLYPELTPQPGIWLTKFAINAKVAVLAANLWIVGDSLRRGVGGAMLVKACLSAGTAGLCLYLLQLGVLASGTVPYGTYLDAGFVGVPSFGSVSIERGHFGKFMASYFPYFLFATLALRMRWRFYLLMLVSLINFSSSSQTFFVAFVVLALWRFWRLVSVRTALTGSLVLGGLLIALATNYLDVFIGVANKVYELAIEGDESTGGGRSVGTFLQYLNSYPLGLGYSGSTLRTAPGLPEINAAHYAFVAQYSLFALPILLGYLALVWRTLRIAKRGPLLSRSLAVGVIMTILVFASDILWFVPLYWLPFEMIWAERRRRQSLSRTLQQHPLGRSAPAIVSSPAGPTM